LPKDQIFELLTDPGGSAHGPTLKVGVVGCGYWGSKHVRVLTAMPQVALVVAIDHDPSTLSSLARRFPQIGTASALADVGAELDAVVVATPARTHGALATEALESGCHVLVEKPLATSVVDAERLVRLGDQRGLRVMSGHTFEYNPAVWKLRTILQQGSLGEIYHIYTARLNLGLFQGDVNVVWDLGPHDISIVNYLLGSRPTSVSAWAGALGHQPVEDVAYLRLHYPDIGLVAQVHLSWLDPCKVRRVTVVGSRKMAVYDDLADDERLKIFDKGIDAAEGAAPAHGQIAYRRGGSECPYIDFREPLAIEDRTFVESILAGEPVPSDGRSGLAVVRVLEAATESMRLGRSVDISYGANIEPGHAAPVEPVPAATVGAGSARNGSRPAIGTEFGEAR